jgi:hypothetical protein
MCGGDVADVLGHQIVLGQLGSWDVLVLGHRLVLRLELSRDRS